MTVQSAIGYAGEMSVTDAYEMLAQTASAVLVDVRTEAEWTFVGAPDLSKIGKETVFIEWQKYPSMKVAGDFAADLLQRLRSHNVGAADPVLFLCRSGARSRAAAIALTQAGQARCYNISEGFEGPLDAERRRGAVAGWKARGLPWTQS